MTNYNYLGYGVTNENGVAKLEYNSEGQKIDHSYTGVGAGEIDVVASLDNPVDESSIVSETYEVLDCYKYDSGMTDYSNIWVSDEFLSRDGDYTTLKEKNIGSTAVCSIANIPFTDYRIEVDVFQVDGNKDEWFLTVMKNDYSPITSADSKLNEWKHISVDLTNIETNSRLRLNTGGTATEMRFKNFKLYPI